jgi:hypothetical protein
MMHRQKKGAWATLAHRNPVFVDDADGRLQKRDIQASEIWASDFRVTLCTTSNQGHLPAHVPSMGHCDKPGTGGERINKVDRLTWPGERYFPYEILIFRSARASNIAQHVGELRAYHLVRASCHQCSHKAAIAHASLLQGRPGYTRLITLERSGGKGCALTSVSRFRFKAPAPVAHRSARSSPWRNGNRPRSPLSLACIQSRLQPTS